MAPAARTALILAALALLLPAVLARDDGLARTPPMGFSTWYAFGANINETRVVQMADAIVRTGLRDAGYRLVNLDDAWLSPSRDRLGNLQGDLVRFPSGIKWLADEMHSRGLLLGLYGCPGVRTCEGYPGQFEHEFQDAATIAKIVRHCAQSSQHWLPPLAAAAARALTHDTRSPRARADVCCSPGAAHRRRRRG